MSDITEGIRDYLASGGLFNPETMDHQKVRDLIIESRDEIERLRKAHEACSWQLRNVLDSRDARDTEIERLRELVRDAWKCAIDDVGSPFLEQTEKRVREALGE